MKTIKVACLGAVSILIVVISGCDPVNKDRMFLIGDLEGKEDFVAVTSDSAVIAVVNSQLAKPVAERKMHINGKIERGNGGHNLAWSWHFTPNQWSLAEMSMELCDGWPGFVEENLDYWIDTVGRFCPWSSYVKSEITTAQ